MLGDFAARVRRQERARRTALLRTNDGVADVAGHVRRLRRSALLHRALVARTDSPCLPAPERPVTGMIKGRYGALFKLVPRGEGGGVSVVERRAQALES